MLVISKPSPIWTITADYSHDIQLVAAITKGWNCIRFGTIHILCCHAGGMGGGLCKMLMFGVIISRDYTNEII